MLNKTLNHQTGKGNNTFPVMIQNILITSCSYADSGVSSSSACAY